MAMKTVVEKICSYKTSIKTKAESWRQNKQQHWNLKLMFHHNKQSSDGMV